MGPSDRKAPFRRGWIQDSDYIDFLSAVGFHPLWLHPGADSFQKVANWLLSIHVQQSQKEESFFPSAAPTKAPG